MRSMSGLGTLVQELAGEDLTGYSDAALRARDWETLRNQVEAGRAAVIAAVHRRGAAEQDGCGSAKAWLRHRLRLAPAAAGALVQTAERYPGLGLFGPALAAGCLVGSEVGLGVWGQD